MGQENNGKINWVVARWVVGIVAAGAVAGVYAMSVPKLGDKIADHETRITVIESHYADIKEGLADIRGDLKAMSRRPTGRYIPAGRTVNSRTIEGVDLGVSE